MILPLLRRVAVLEVMDGMGYLWALVQFIEWQHAGVVVGPYVLLGKGDCFGEY